METALVQSGFALEAYARYLSYERRAKNPDLLVMGAVYERAIAEAAKRRFDGEPGAEETLRAFWTGYCDTLVCAHLRLCLLQPIFLLAYHRSGRRPRVCCLEEGCEKCAWFRRSVGSIYPISGTFKSRLLSQ
jgi:hypothetical protein